MISPVAAAMLRRSRPEALVDEYANYCVEAFGAELDQATPVVIAAYNEAHDLPATLAALARSSEPVRPIVVDNGSTDGTDEVARAMGADTHRLERPSKMRAIQYGVEYAAWHEARTVLFTDADTLVGRNWAGHMIGKLSVRSDETEAVFISGGISAWHGPSKAADSLRTVHQAVGHIRNVRRGGRPAAHGGNMGINFNEPLLQRFLSIDPQLFAGEDAAIRDVAIRESSKLARTMHPDGFVLTRGDRFENWHEYWNWWRNPQTRRSHYARDLAALGLRAYDGENAFKA